MNNKNDNKYERKIKELVNDEFNGYEYKYIGSNADISNLIDGATWSIHKGNEKLKEVKY